MNAKDYIQLWENNPSLNEFRQQKSVLDTKTRHFSGKLKKSLKEKLLIPPIYFLTLTGAALVAWNFTHNLITIFALLCAANYAWIGIINYIESLKNKAYANHMAKLYFELKSSFFNRQTLAPLISFLFTHSFDLKKLNQFVEELNKNQLSHHDIVVFLNLNDEMVKQLSKKPSTKSIQKFLEENNPKNSRQKYLEIL